jgi:hypothetical protein
MLKMHKLDQLFEEMSSEQQSSSWKLHGHKYASMSPLFPWQQGFHLLPTIKLTLCHFLNF